MDEKNTRELTEILGKTHLSEFGQYCSENKDSMNFGTADFFRYMKECLKKKGISQQTMFLKADIPERYGYKLLSGEKHTRQRDVILRLCYAAELSLEETKRALEKYGMPALYPKVPRDAFLMIVFNERPGNIIEVNELMKKNELEPLRSSGMQD